MRQNYSGDKRRKEEARRKKQEEKRNRRLNKSKDNASESSPEQAVPDPNTPNLG